MLMEACPSAEGLLSVDMRGWLDDRSNHPSWPPVLAYRLGMASTGMAGTCLTEVGGQIPFIYFILMAIRNLP